MPKLIETLNPEVAALLHEHPFQEKSEDLLANTALPRMAKDPTKEPLRPAVGRTGHALASMPARFEALAAAGPNDHVMPAFIIGPERAAEALKAKPALPQKEMEALPGSRVGVLAGQAIASDGYVRLRVRVTDDRMRILSAQNVEGPLAQPQSIIGQHAYEVTLDGERVAAEGIPDVGLQRSFPRPGQHEHHVTELTSFEFNVRVPRASVPNVALERLQINLYRFPDATPKAIAGKARLSQQLGPQAHVVARIEGLRTQYIDPVAIEHFGKIFPSLKIR